ncbi:MULTISPECIES: glycosyltransferase family 2 protein [unclassified Serratia (in: enterobacteria)]|uniref:glycosyltransferase family 2 protein n=1 Tax=unclassified Serratia (in: enterobacteria) TaxID=2647522 RepID=UPI0004682EA6|nr:MULTISPECIES: glycosyltransferase [unclassified Serratia (in: enterobacteria)]
MNFKVVIPTYNGGDIWKQGALALYSVLKEMEISSCNVIVIDSSSTDDTVRIARNYGFYVHSISSNDFNHGGTRNLAFDLIDKKDDIIIFLTQDSVVQNKSSIIKLLSSFDDELVACAYGRQLPHNDANPISRHARLFNYKEKCYVSSLASISEMGMKAAFMSNSFSAYRVATFSRIGRFPENTILSEDMYFAANAILSNYKVAYISTACVKHSHNYSFYEEFKRYFDIGVFHSDAPWIRNKFGGAGGEGKKFIFSEFNYLVLNSARNIPRAMINNFFKLLGYKLGQNYRFLPKSIILRFSMHKGFWR